MCEYSGYATCNKVSISVGASIVGHTRGASVEAAVLSTIRHATWDVYFLENTAHFSVNWVLSFGWKRTNTEANSSPRHQTRLSPEINRNRKPVSVFSFWSWTVDASICASRMRIGKNYVKLSICGVRRDALPVRLKSIVSQYRNLVFFIQF